MLTASACRDLGSGGDVHVPHVSVPSSTRLPLLMTATRWPNRTGTPFTICGMLTFQSVSLTCSRSRRSELRHIDPDRLAVFHDELLDEVRHDLAIDLADLAPQRRARRRRVSAALPTPLPGISGTRVEMLVAAPERGSR